MEKEMPKEMVHVVVGNRIGEHFSMKVAMGATIGELMTRIQTEHNIPIDEQSIVVSDDRSQILDMLADSDENQTPRENNFPVSVVPIQLGGGKRKNDDSKEERLDEIAEALENYKASIQNSNLKDFPTFVALHTDIVAVEKLMKETPETSFTSIIQTFDEATFNELLQVPKAGTGSGDLQKRIQAIRNILFKGRMRQFRTLEKKVEEAKKMMITATEGILYPQLGDSGFNLQWSDYTKVIAKFIKDIGRKEGEAQIGGITRGVGSLGGGGEDDDDEDDDDDNDGDMKGDTEMIPAKTKSWQTTQSVRHRTRLTDEGGWVKKRK